MAKNLITRTEFAKLAGTSGANITKLCKTKLKDAVEGRFIDAGHTCAVAYLESRGVKAETKPHVRGTAARAQKRQQQPVDEQRAQIQVDDNIAQYVDMTLRQILELFGTQPAFEAWLKSAKLIEELREKRLKNAKAEGEYIERDMVANAVLGYVAGNNERLLSDAPRAIVARIAASFKAGRTEEEMEAEVTQILSSQIKLVKQKTLKGLRSAESPTPQ